MTSVFKSVCHGFGFISSAAGVFCAYEIYTGNKKFYKNCLMPFLQRFVDAENSHKAAIKCLSWNIIPKSNYNDDNSLAQVVWNKKFPNPLGIAAGFDKDAEAMLGLSKIGFGFVEVGSITPLPQEGNIKPRVFRLDEDKAIINRYGFNSCGHASAKLRLQNFRKTSHNNLIVGVNLGKNKTSRSAVQDYVSGVEQLGEFADYIVVNVSSPNTPGLRSLQGKEELEKLCNAVLIARDKIPSKPPVLVKIAPDLTPDDKTDIAEVMLKTSVDGLIISNTTVQRPDELQSHYKPENGGLSGPPLRTRSTEIIREMYQLTKGSIPIIGVGGISSGNDAYKKITAGASLVQLYTAMAFHGPPVITSVKKDLVELLKRDGYTNITDAVGADHRK